MFDVGMLEIIVILVLALIVLGPERLPQAARSVGYWFGKMRRYVEGVKAEVEKEFDTSELKRMLHNQEVQIRELQNKLNETPADLLEANPLENDDDPGSGHKPNPDFDIIEEDDDEYDQLEVTPAEVKQQHAKQQKAEQDKAEEDKNNSREKNADIDQSEKTVAKAEKPE